MKAMKKILIGLVIASLFLSIPQKIMAAEYLVTFVVNGGDKSSQPEALHLTSGATFNVDDISIPTRSGYDFIGWKFNNEIVSGMMTMPDSAVRLVAQWQGKGQSVVFDFLLTDVGNKQPDYSVGLDEVIQTSNFLVPTHSRYTFLGWTINGKDIVTEVTVRNGGMRLIAKWGGSYEEIHFDVAGGIAPISLGTRQIAVGEMLDLATIPQPTRQGYSFSGWAESDNVIVHNYQVKELGTTFFAQWQEIYDSLSITVQHTERSIEASKDKPNIEDLFGVSAEDLYDGNVSENVMYKLEGIDFTKVGVYPIEISVRNFRNQLLRKTVSLKIVDTTAPTIVVEHEERELKIGDSQLSDYGKLFGVGVTDIVDKNVVADFEEVDSVDKQRPGKYKIRITAEDSSGNRRTKDVLLVLQPIEIAGVVFLDENYNSLKDDLQVVPEVSLQLVDGETKKVLQIVRTNGKGEYRFTNVTATGGYTGVADTYTISFAVVEEPTTTIDAVATVTAGSVPVLTVTPAVVEVSKDAVVDLTTGVSVTDAEDATLNITNNGPLNTSATGVQIITYSVTDTDGNTVTANRTYVITSVDEPAVIGTTHVIFASGFTKGITQVDTTNAAIIQAANARVFSLTGTSLGRAVPNTTVVVNSIGGYTAISGTYTIEFAAEAEPLTKIQITATVTDDIAPAAPIVDGINPGDTTITGEAEPNTDIKITLPDGTVVTGTTDGDGKFVVDLPTGVELVEGDKVIVVVVDENGNTSTPTEVIVTDTVKPTAPIVDGINPGDTTITGEAEPNTDIQITLPDGTVIVGTTDEDGKFVIDLPAGVELVEDDRVIVVAVDENGNTSAPTEVIVTDTVAPAAPIVDGINPGDTTITGQAEPNTDIEITLPDGTVITGTTDENGRFVVDLPAGVELVEGDKIEVVAIDENGNTSAPTEVIVTDTVLPKAPVINEVNETDTVITGTGEPGATITVTLPDGTKLTGTVDPDGTFTIDIPGEVTLQAGDKITGVQTDENGNTSAPTEVIVVDTTAPSAPTVNPVDNTDTVITGTGEPGATITITLPDGTKLTGTVDPDGTFTIDIPNHITLNPGDELEVVQTDESGNRSNPVDIFVTDNIAPLAPVINPITSGDTTITGTGEPGATITITLPDGTTLTGTVNPDGTFTIDIPAGTILKSGDTVTGVQTDQGGNTSEPTVVTVSAKKITSPIVDPINPGDTIITGIGEPGATITVTFPDGTTVTTVVEPDGTFKVEIPTGTILNPGDIITIIQTDKDGNTSDPVNIVVGEKEESAPSPTPTPEVPLPVTGEKTLEVIIIGMLLAILGMLVLVFRRKRRNIQ